MESVVRGPKQVAVGTPVVVILTVCASGTIRTVVFFGDVGCVGVVTLVHVMKPKGYVW